MGSNPSSPAQKPLTWSRSPDCVTNKEPDMYLHLPRSQKRDRKKGARYTAKLKAKNRRRVNRMQGRKLSKARSSH